MVAAQPEKSQAEPKGTASQHMWLPQSIAGAGPAATASDDDATDATDWFPEELLAQLPSAKVQLIANRDSRTSLTAATSRVHEKLLLLLTRLGWDGLIARIRQSSLAPSSQRSLLAKAIGAAKRTAQYGFAQVPPPPSALFDTLALLDRILRCELAMDGSIIDMSTLTHHQQSLGETEAGATFYVILATAHRGTSIAAIQAHDIFVVRGTQPPTTLILRFREGKTEKSTGTYSLAIAAPEWVIDRIRSMVQKDKRPFARHMKAAHGELPLRSLRRTALQRMAAAGTPAATLLLFSRHTSEVALRHYLAGGVVLRDQAELTTPASQIWMQ